MRTIYAVTMWSGGMAAKKWQTYEKPELLPQGTGIKFICRESRLSVEVIGSVSIEEYESGKEEIEAIRDRFGREAVEARPNPEPPARKSEPSNGIERLF